MTKEADTSRDEETANLLREDPPSRVSQDPPAGEVAQAHPPKQDSLTDAAFWLFMLFLASVTMTVGNKVCANEWKRAITYGIHTLVDEFFDNE